MSYNPDRHHRRSIRLRGYDYAQVGAYYITLCTHGRAWFFGRIVGGVMSLSEAGQIAERELLQTPDVRPNTQIDAYVVMPNHVHIIFVIVYRDADTPQQATAFRSPSRTAGAIVRGYKGAVTRQVNKLRGTEEPVWQRNYYEHIVRNDADLNRIRRYIEANPALAGRSQPARGLALTIAASVCDTPRHTDDQRRARSAYAIRPDSMRYAPTC